MADKKISELTTLLAADVATNDVLPIVDSSATETKKLTAGDLKAYTFAGNIPLTGSAVRITGDFSNATTSNRVMFQTSTVNVPSDVGVIPNGTATQAGLRVYNTTNPNNSASTAVLATSVDSSIRAAITGTGTYLPMTFYTGGSEQVRIDTSGNVGIGTTASTATRLQVNSATGIPATFYGNSGATAMPANSSFGLTIAGNLSSGSAEVNLVYGSAGAGLWISSYDGTTRTDRVKIDATGNVGIGKTATAKLDVNGNIKSDANIAGGYIAHAAGTTAMGFGIDNVVRVTPNATATYTTTVPSAGSIVVLSILTSGTTSYTITFGTGFKATGTLATGTVSARYFNLTFVSDGTNLIETGRTVAIA